MKFQTFMKWVLYALVLVLSALLQNYIFSRLPVAGVTPLLLGSLSVCVGMYEGGAAGAIFGAVAGASMYSLGGSSELIYAAVYAAAGLAAGELCENIMRRRLVGALLLSLAANACATVFYFVLIVWIPGRAGLYALLRVGLIEIAYSTALTPLLYAPVRALGLAAARDGERT